MNTKAAFWFNSKADEDWKKFQDLKEVIDEVAPEKPKSAGMSVSEAKDILTSPQVKEHLKRKRNGFGDIDIPTMALSGGGALLGHTLASSIFDEPEEDIKKRSVWKRLLATLIPLGVGGLGAYGGYALGNYLKKSAQDVRGLADDAYSALGGAAEDYEKGFGDAADRARNWAIGSGAAGLVGLGTGAYGGYRWLQGNKALKDMAEQQKLVDYTTGLWKAEEGKLPGLEQGVRNAEQALVDAQSDAQVPMDVSKDPKLRQLQANANAARDQAADAKAQLQSVESRLAYQREIAKRNGGADTVHLNDPTQPSIAELTKQQDSLNLDASRTAETSGQAAKELEDAVQIAQQAQKADAAKAIARKKLALTDAQRPYDATVAKTQELYGNIPKGEIGPTKENAKYLERFFNTNRKGGPGMDYRIPASTKAMTYGGGLGAISGLAGALYFGNNAVKNYERADTARDRKNRIMTAKGGR